MINDKLGQSSRETSGQVVLVLVQQEKLPAAAVRKREQEAKEAAGFRKVYNDPKLKSPKVYGQLVRRMVASGVAELALHEKDVSEHVGLFTVAKKSGKLRPAVGARHARFWFGQPSYVDLATGLRTRPLSCNRRTPSHRCCLGSGARRSSCDWAGSSRASGGVWAV